MVKGISRQVLVVSSPDPELFDQAIFILRDEAVGKGVTDEALLKEAQRAIRTARPDEKKRRLRDFGPVWACGGAALTGLAWLICTIV